MTYNEYQKLAVRTCKVYEDNNMNLLHMAVGLHSEFDELMAALQNDDVVNIGEEIADHMWYLAVYCHFVKLPFNHIVMINPDPVPYSLERLTSKFLDLVKKRSIYGKWDSTLLHQEGELLTFIVQKLYDFTDAFGLDMSKILENNIEKLKVRFPEKYTDLSANNRNLDAEYEQLKK